MAFAGPSTSRDTSARVKEGDKRRVLDAASRERRQQKFLEALEADNYHDDPHADLVMSKKAPKFQDQLELRGRKKKEKSAEYFKLKYRKTLQQMIEEIKTLNVEPPNYVTAKTDPSPVPPRQFCCVCGFFSNFTCVTCGAKYCSIKCLNTHQETRCLKWTS